MLDRDHALAEGAPNHRGLSLEGGRYSRPVRGSRHIGDCAPPSAGAQRD